MRKVLTIALAMAGFGLFECGVGAASLEAAVTTVITSATKQTFFGTDYLVVLGTIDDSNGNSGGHEINYFGVLLGEQSISDDETSGPDTFQLVVPYNPGDQGQTVPVVGIGYIPTDTGPTSFTYP